jgi:hypothetical protein
MKLSAISSRPRLVRLTEPWRRASGLEPQPASPKGGPLGQFDVEAALRRETCSVGVSPALSWRERDAPATAGGTPTLRLVAWPSWP